MFKLLYSLALFQQLDPRIYELQKDVEFYRILVIGSVLVIVILILVVFLQRLTIVRSKHLSGAAYEPSKPAGEKTEAPSAVKDNKTKKVSSGGAINPKDLPDPGLIFKYSLAKEEVTEKLITIGQTTGSIKTYSTEIINDHLNIHIRIMENRSEKDIYNLPDSIYEEYLIDIRREGKALIYYPGLDAFRQMGSRERIYIMKEEDPAGDPTFANIEPKQPIRIRLGERLNQDDKFVNGYFEFHLFSQEYEAKTSAGITKFEKNFMLRLYRVYPGYDVSSPDKSGLYPMMDPFSSAGK